MLKPCVVFDLDGTLADTSGDLLEAANVCFRALGHGDLLKHGPDSGVALRGGRAMLRLGFSRVGAVDEAEVDAQYPILLNAYDQNIDQKTTLYPGVLDALTELENTGYVSAICTNKPEGLARKLMTRLGVLDRFASLVGADTLPVRKPDPAPFWLAVEQANGDTERCLLVGDSDTDRNTSKAAVRPSVLVTFGPSGEDMAALSPDALMDDYSDLLTIVQELIGR